MATRATIDHPESTGRDGAIDHMAKFLDGAPAGSQSRRLHTSPNGESWYLVNDTMGPSIVHVPNGPSGRQADRVTIAAFLAAGDGLEQRELMRLIGTLVDHA
jgi:hypothetical protein